MSEHEHDHNHHDPLGDDALSRSAERRASRDVIEEGAPREGVDIIRQVERAIIVGVELDDRDAHEVEQSLDELEALLDTAGGVVIKRVVQKRDRPDAATYIGSGKVEEIRQLAKDLGADAVVFDDDLTPAQQRTLEENVRQKVLDRTIVILDIFAQHAHSREGKAQVELAQLQYLLPRLRGWGTALSRQEGRIGTRGPGESQLEVDRRRIMRRVSKLRKDIRGAEATRDVRTKRRRQSGIPVVALVGYTNAGKSTLMNALTGAKVLVKDQLFATLDTTARRLELPQGRQAVLTDTVGFIRKLPHGLVDAFASTLRESADADLLLVVADATHPEMLSHLETAHRVLTDVGAAEVPAIVVLNKTEGMDSEDVDRLIAQTRWFEGLKDGEEPIAVSALTEDGIDELRAEIEDRLADQSAHLDAWLPLDRADLVALAHRHGQVTLEEWTDKGVHLIADLDSPTAEMIAAEIDNGS